MSATTRAAAVLCLALSVGQGAQTFAAEAPVRHACELISQVDAEAVFQEAASKIDYGVLEVLRLGRWDYMDSWCGFLPARNTVNRPDAIPRLVLSIGFAPFANGQSADEARKGLLDSSSSPVPGFRYERVNLPNATAIWTFDVARNTSQLEAYSDNAHLILSVFGIADDQATLAWARDIVERALAKL